MNRASEVAASTVLTVAGHDVAHYHDGAEMTAGLAPRPYLHPVRSPAREVLTEVRPADHHHHYGLSNAVVDINGTTYWGGKSYVDGQGYVMLPNQGRQAGGPVAVVTEGHRTALTQRLTWTDSAGAHQVIEDRDIRLAVATGKYGPAHLLTWRSVLHAQADLTIGSPATRGRTGAGYGGLFWRFGPESGVDVRVRIESADGDDALVTGEANALGAVGPWLTLTQQRANAPVTLLLAQPRAALLPWFVRVSGYTGAGPAIAFEQPLAVPRGTHLTMHLWAALLDAELDATAADSLYVELEKLAA